jgi:hypothetical protein
MNVNFNANADEIIICDHTCARCKQVPSRCYTVSGNISSSSNSSNAQASIDCYSVPQDTTVTSRGAGGTDGCLVTVFKTPATGNESSLTGLAPQVRTSIR